LQESLENEHKWRNYNSFKHILFEKLKENLYKSAIHIKETEDFKPVPIQLVVTPWKRKLKQDMVLKYNCEGYNATP
jgi:hypothetical protein